jgi:hypothetical protein
VYEATGLERIYKIAGNNFLVSSGALLDRPGFVCDDLEDFDEQRMREYFKNSWAIFVERLRRFKYLQRRLTPLEEKELKFMLEALISAKNILEGEKGE